jgi:hypothetical protein
MTLRLDVGLFQVGISAMRWLQPPQARRIKGMAAEFHSFFRSPSEQEKRKEKAES